MARKSQCLYWRREFLRVHVLVGDSPSYIQPRLHRNENIVNMCELSSVPDSDHQVFRIFVGECVV